jgi:hypothetical protein
LTINVKGELIVTSEELRDKLDALFTQIGVQTAPWAVTLLKTAQSKNIDIAEWNTFVYKVATVAASTDVLVQIADTIAKTFANLTGGAGDGSVQSKSSEATAAYAMALGKGLVASVEALAAFGKYNKNDASALLVVGNGTDENSRSNAFTVHEDGTVSAGANGKNDFDLVTKKQLDQATSGLTDDLAKYKETVQEFFDLLYTENNADDDDSLIERLQIAINAIDALIPKDLSNTDADESTQATENKLVLRDVNGRAYVKDATDKETALKDAAADCVVNVNVLRNELAKKLNTVTNKPRVISVYAATPENVGTLVEAHSTNMPGIVYRDAEGQTCVGPPKSGESAANSYLLKRHLGRHSKLYPIKVTREGKVEVVNKLKFTVPDDNSYFAKVGDNCAVGFEEEFAVHIPSVVPNEQYFESTDSSYVPVDLPVNSISLKAFRQNHYVRSLVIQEGVTRIEAEAFDGCRQLTSIVLADTIKMIDNHAFNNVGINISDAKIFIKLPKALEWICQYAFNNVNVCGSITFPNRCLYIGGVPDDLTAGKGYVFTSPNITQIVFEGTPKYIHADSFLGCTCDVYVPWSEGEVKKPKDSAWGSTGRVYYNTSYSSYVKTSIDDLRARLDAINDKENYEKITVGATLQSNQSDVSSIYEHGTSLTNLSLTWIASKPPTKVQVTYGNTTVDLPSDQIGKTGRYDFSTNMTVTSDFSWKLTVYEKDYKGDEESDSATGTVEFCYGIYYGVSTNPELKASNVTVKSFTRALRTKAYDFSFTTTAGKDEYIYVCVPVAYGECKFKTSQNFIEVPKLTDTDDITTLAGDSTQYRVYRSINANLGPTTFTLIDAKDGE